MEDEHTTQWPKENGQKDKQRSTKNTHKTKDRVTQTEMFTNKHNYNKLPLHILPCHSIRDPGTNADNNPPHNIYAIIFVNSLTGNKDLLLFNVT